MKYIGLPRPSYPLWAMLEPVSLAYCNIEKKKFLADQVLYNVEFDTDYKKFIITD
jgi:hypothetical protein